MVFSNNIMELRAEGFSVVKDVDRKLTELFRSEPFGFMNTYHGIEMAKPFVRPGTDQQVGFYFLLAGLYDTELPFYLISGALYEKISTQLEWIDRRTKMRDEMIDMLNQHIQNGVDGLMTLHPAIPANIHFQGT